MIDALKDIGQAAGVKVSLEQYLTTPNNTVKAVSFEAVPLEKAIAQIVSPHYFKLFVYAAENADKNAKPAPVSLVVYRIWKNNEPQTVIYEPTTKTRSEIEANSRIVGGDGKTIGLRQGTRDWGIGETTDKDSPFTYGKSDQQKYWIDNVKNPGFDSTQTGELFFAYVLGKSDDTSALVRVEAKRQNDDVLTFQFNVIHGQIDNDGESKIEFFTKLKNSPLDAAAVKLNRETLPKWDEGYPEADVSFSKDYDSNSNGWTSEFEIKPVTSDPMGNNRIINHVPINPGYYLVYVKGGDNNQAMDGFGAYCLMNTYDGGNKAKFLVLTGGNIDNDGDVYVNHVQTIRDISDSKDHSIDHDNIFYQSYQDKFLLYRLNLSETTQILADVLPSHMLYSPEDYVWDSARLKLVETGNEVCNPYVQSERNCGITEEQCTQGSFKCQEGHEGTIGKMFKDFKGKTDMPADKERTPIIFIHGWEGDRSDAFSILHDYGWSKSFLKDQPMSGEAYWRNLLTYMYKYHGEDFKKYKPYVYHYPTYKHIPFNARMLKELIDEFRGKDDCLGNENKKIIIVAHSMGTLVSRTLMETYGMLYRVDKFISLAGVHHGSPASIKSLVDSTKYAEVLKGKNLITPGACDLMSDNYDGLISTDAAGDIKTLWGIDLLDQRNLVGSVFLTSSKEYDTTNKKFFDWFYLNSLPINPENSYFPGKKVPLFPNPWLMTLNKYFYSAKKDAAKDKYLFYTGFSVAQHSPGGLASWTYSSIPSDPDNPSEWTDTLSNSALSFDAAAMAVAGATDYKFNDSVVPVSSGILDFERGRLLQNGKDIKTNYIKTGMPSDLPDYGPGNGITEDDLKNNYVYRSKNGWGAKIRVIYDYHHDRMLSGGYSDGSIDDFNYRQNKTSGVFSDHGIGFNNKDIFLDYYRSVHIPDPYPLPDMKFENDPLFEQIRMDILGISQPFSCSNEFFKYNVSELECQVIQQVLNSQYGQLYDITNGKPLQDVIGTKWSIEHVGDKNEGRIRLKIENTDSLPFSVLGKEIDIIWASDTGLGYNPSEDTLSITDVITVPKPMADAYFDKIKNLTLGFPSSFYKADDGKPRLVVEGGYFTTDISNNVIFVSDFEFFADVPSTHTYFAPVMWAANTDKITRDNPIKILMGYSDQYFRPEEKISRAELLKYVMLAAGKGKLDAAAMPTSDTDRFNDDPVKRKLRTAYDLALDGKDWAWAFVYKARNEGIVKGYPDGDFKPQNIINVAEATKIIVEAFNLTQFKDASKAWPETYRKFWEGDASVHSGYPVFAEISPLTSSADWGKFPTRAQLVDMVRFAYDKSTTKPVTLATTEKELVCPVLDKDNPITYGDNDVTIRFSSAVTESVASAGVKLYVETSPSRKLLKNITFVSKGLGQYELTVEKPTDLASGDYDLTLEVYGEKATSPTPLKLKIGTGTGSGNASVLVLDVSGSMNENVPNGTAKKIDVSKAAAKYYIGLVSEGSYLGIIVFSSSSYIMKDITALTSGNRQEFIDQIDKIKITASTNSACPPCGGGTNLTCGIGAGDKAAEGARFLLDKVAGQVSLSTIVMLTDGQGTWDTTLEQKLKAENRVVHTIGLGSGVDSKLLEGIASNTNGTYHYIENSSESELSKAFGKVATVGQSGLGVGSVKVSPGSVAEKIFRIDSSVTDDISVQVNTDIPADKLSVSLKMPDGTIAKIFKDKPNPYGIILTQSGNSLSFIIPNSKSKPGEWKVMLESTTETKADFIISAKSSISLKAGLDNSGYKVGDKGKLYTAISAGKAVSGVKVRAKVSYTAAKTTRSDVSTPTEEWIELYDDGQHGDGAANDGVYGGYYTFKGTGEHNVVVYADGYTENSDRFTREFEVPAVSVAAMVDEDKDGMPDAWEELNGLHPNGSHPLNTNPGAVDTDGDGLTDLQEFQKGTVPYIADSDGDGISDGEEVSKYHTNPSMADTDGGGMPDNVEIQQGKNPNEAKDEGAFYDVNHDSKVTDADLGEILRIWNTCVGDARYNQALDFNHNGCIDVWDVMAVIVQMQATN